MSKWLRVDASGFSAAYLEWHPSSLPIGNGFTLDFDLVVPSATATALLAASNPNWAADWFLVGIQGAGAPNFGGVFAQIDTGPVLTQWNTLGEFEGHSPAGSIPLDTIVHVTYEVVFNSGTSWDFTVKIDGATVDSFTRNTGLDTTATWEFLDFGAAAAGGYTGEVYYLSNVVVKDGSGSTIFSDDFTDVTFPSSLGPWTSGTSESAMSIVDSPPVAGSPDFTINASPTSATHTTPGSLTVEIDVGLVTSAETVNLTIDDSGLPDGVTASLDVSIGTTPYTAMLTLTAASLAACDTGNVTIEGDDGTNTHSVTIPVAIDGTDGAYDETEDGAQIGSAMSQSGENIDSGNMGVYDGELYWAWTEQGDAAGPYVAKWNEGTSDWDVIADQTVFEPGSTFSSRLPVLRTDGTYLYLTYLAERPISILDCRNLPDGTLDITPFFAQVWRYDGATWTFLGDLGCGCVINDGGGEDASVALELTAGPAEVGACYVAFFEEGYEGPNATQYPASRHLTVAGFGTSTLGEVSFDDLLFQPDRPVDEIGRCDGSTDFAAQLFSMRLVDTGENLTLYAQELAYNQFVAPFWTILQVWQPAGFLPDVTLATDFPYSGPGTLIGYGAPLAVSNDVGSARWVMVERPNTFITENMVVRQTTEAAPGTFGFTFGIADGSADSIFAEMNKLIGEPGNLWAIDTDDTGNILLLTNRCGQVFWANFTGGTFASGIPYTGDPVIFDDAFWLSGGTGHGDVKAFRAAICRGCGECCGLSVSPAGVRHHRQRLGAAA
jgi:hypothetical protein